jgi:hypothetical protein
MLVRHHQSEADQGNHNCKYDHVTQQCRCTCTQENSTFVSALLHGPWVDSFPPGLKTYHHPCPPEAPKWDEQTGACIGGGAIARHNEHRDEPAWNGLWKCPTHCKRYFDGTRMCDCVGGRIGGQCDTVSYHRGESGMHCAKWDEHVLSYVRLGAGAKIVVGASAAKNWDTINPGAECMMGGRPAGTKDPNAKLIVAGDTPDLNKVGEYRIIYQCKDAIDRLGPKKTFTVKVVMSAFEPSRQCPIDCARWSDGCAECDCVAGITQGCGSFNCTETGEARCIRVHNSERPVIKLHGYPRMTYEVASGKGYKEDGATCKSADGLRDLSVTISGLPDLDKVGIYRVVFGCKDPKFVSMAAPVTRVVTVESKKPAESV